VQTWTALTSDRWPPALCARALAESRYAWLRLRPVARRFTFSQVVSCVASSYVACRGRVGTLVKRVPQTGRPPVSGVTLWNSNE